MWDTDTTEWSFYLDGVHQISQTKGHLSGYIVQGGGTFHLGQFVQNGAYKVAKAYQGWITGLNIWTTRLSSRTVAALAEEPGTEKGDALSWSMFRRGITGDVQIYNDYTLEMTGICARSTLPRRRFLGELEIRAPLSRHDLRNKIGRLHQNNSTPTLLQPAASNVFATLEREGTWAKLDFAKTSGNDLGTHYSAIGQFLLHVSSNSPKILCKSYLYPVSPRFLSGEIAAWAGQERFSCGLGWVGLRLCVVG